MRRFLAEVLVFLVGSNPLVFAPFFGAKNKIAGRIILLSVLGFWGKNTAGIMLFHRDFPATTTIWASKPGSGYNIL